MSDTIPSIVCFTKENNPYVRVFSGGFTYLNFNDLLKPARNHKFGVVAVNCRHRVITEAALEAAWLEHSPIILEIAESETKYCNMPPQKLADIVGTAIERLIARFGYTVPVALHMDHVQKDVTLIDRSIEAGFSSALADFSKAEVDENIKKSIEVVQKLHPLGLSVELEEGEIGEAAALNDPEVDSHIEDYYTKVDDAYKLATACRPDALAIFIGNAHGKYLKEPKIGFERIREVNEAVKEFDIPLVLHGGSYLSYETFNRCIDLGVAKVNYATAISDIMFEFLPEVLVQEMDEKAKELNTSRRKVIYLFEERINTIGEPILQKIHSEIVNHLRQVMREGFRSSGKAELYYSVASGNAVIK